MGKIAEDREADLVQHLNVAMQGIRIRGQEDHRATLQREAGIFITEEHDTEHKFLVRSLDGPIATFSLEELPGCCGMMVSYHSEVVPRLRDKGMGSALLEVRMNAARGAKYGALLATVDATNKAEIAILTKAGWTKRGEFRNPRTGNIIETYQVNL